MLTVLSLSLSLSRSLSLSLSLGTIIDSIISSSRFSSTIVRSCAKISILWVLEFYYLILIENRNDMKPKYESC